MRSILLFKLPETAYSGYRLAEKRRVFYMSDAERLRIVEMENVRLKDENMKLHKVIEKLNQTLNRLIGRYISADKIA